MTYNPRSTPGGGSTWQRRRLTVPAVNSSLSEKNEVSGETKPRNAMIVPNAPEVLQNPSERHPWGDGATPSYEECGSQFPPRNARHRFCAELCKDRPGHRRRYGAQPQELTCHRCGVEWTRAAQTGRLPHLCPECRSGDAMNFTRPTKGDTT